MTDRIIPNIWKEWEIEKKIGEGTFGTVYLAKKETETGVIRNAIKIIEIPSEASDTHQLLYEFRKAELVRLYYGQMVDDYLNEIKIMNSLKGHNNIVSIDDYLVEEKEDSIGWKIYIRMEYLKSFSDYYLEEKVTEQDILRMGIDICTALESCADFHIVHRDIKPDNIFVSKRGDYKLGDFGVAKQADRTLGSFSAKGTFSYMAPEVYRGEKYGTAADIYSLGITLYKLLNKNRDPFVNTEKQIIYYKDRDEALTRRMKGEELPYPVEASRAVAEVLKKATAFQPKDRYQTASEFKKALTTALRKVAAGHGKRMSVTGMLRKVAPVAAAGAAVAAIAFSLSSPRLQNTVIQGSIAQTAAKVLEALQNNEVQKTEEAVSVPSEESSAEGTVATNVLESLAGYTSTPPVQAPVYDAAKPDFSANAPGPSIPWNATNEKDGVLEAEDNMTSTDENDQEEENDENAPQVDAGKSYSTVSTAPGSGVSSYTQDVATSGTGTVAPDTGNASFDTGYNRPSEYENPHSFNNYTNTPGGNTLYDPPSSTEEDLTISSLEPVLDSPEPATPTPTPTPAPTPRSDFIIDEEPASNTTPVSGSSENANIVVNNDENIVTVGKKLNLKYETSSDEEIKWHSEDEKIASIPDNDGTVIGKKHGSTTIWAEQGDVKTKYSVTVQKNVYDAKLNKKQVFHSASDGAFSFIPSKVYYENESMRIEGFFVNKMETDVNFIHRMLFVFSYDKDDVLAGRTVLMNKKIKVEKKGVIPYTLTLQKKQFNPNIDLRLVKYFTSETICFFH